MAVTDLPPADTLDQEEQIERDQVAARFTDLVARLSRQSVVKNYDAYADIPWDDPAYAIDPDDPRWEITAGDPFGATDWYRSQPQTVRARIGLYRYASAMKIGLQFENILKRGLLEYAFLLPNRDVTFRYAYHEVIEEAHHGLMFQEFVNRAPFDIRGLAWRERILSRQIVMLGQRFPELFFFFVLGGEDPIDHLQREVLRSRDDLHPLLEIIMRHHVTEEARHLSFARHYLKLNVPRLGRGRRFVLSVAVPLILGEMAAMMMRTPTELVRLFGVPAEVLREAYDDNPTHRDDTIASLRKVRRLSEECGLMNAVSRRLWKVKGIA